jgi:hypothetical protein
MVLMRSLKWLNALTIAAFCWRRSDISICGIHVDVCTLKGGVGWGVGVGGGGGGVT